MYIQARRLIVFRGTRFWGGHGRFGGRGTCGHVRFGGRPHTYIHMYLYVFIYIAALRAAKKIMRYICMPAGSARETALARREYDTGAKNAPRECYRAPRAIPRRKMLPRAPTPPRNMLPRGPP